jgi:DNA-binding XRE family transcriptional regulator
MEKKITSHVRAYRRRWGFTQDELAFLIGLKSRSVVSKLECCESLPTLVVGLALYSVFGARSVELFPVLFREVEAGVLRGRTSWWAPSGKYGANDADQAGFCGQKAGDASRYGLRLRVCLMLITVAQRTAGDRKMPVQRGYVCKSAVSQAGLRGPYHWPEASADSKVMQHPMLRQQYRPPIQQFVENLNVGNPRMLSCQKYENDLPLAQAVAEPRHEFGIRAEQRSVTGSSISGGARYNGAARRIARPGNGSRSWSTTFSLKSETSIRHLLIASSSNTRGGSRVPELGLLGSVRGALSQPWILWRWKLLRSTEQAPPPRPGAGGPQHRQFAVKMVGAGARGHHLGDQSIAAWTLVRRPYFGLRQQRSKLRDASFKRCYRGSQRSQFTFKVHSTVVRGQRLGNQPIAAWTLSAARPSDFATGNWGRRWKLQASLSFGR